MSTTEILLFAILIAIIMVFFSILVFGLDNQYGEYRKRWEKIKKDQIDDVKSLEKKLVSSLQAQLSQKIHLNKIVNKNIFGGIIIQIKSIMIDQSILTRLSNFNLSMKG